MRPLVMIVACANAARTLAFTARAPGALRSVSTALPRAPLMRMPRPLALAPVRGGRALKAAATTELANQELITDDPNNNVTPYIANLVGRSLHRQPAHPLGIIKSKIEECVRARACAKWMPRALFVASPCARAGSRG